MNQQLVGNASALLPEANGRTFQVDCVPQDDRGYYQVESAGAIPLILKGSISHFTEAVKEHCTGPGVLRFSFVQNT